ncbi:tripartite tricarboxylate transporter TctB family protein [Halomonas sp. LR3S48]|uniref:tripartite tricarboxylate transporter TctB family protein n=1 Tax=Halomonas sp. LR3S48 TaxID=2982694 RepID=UPI0021E47F30|nr:tripartite tricarboxylate transporter TctB family protein [Halomonas sp. LR3S48]UYG04374.1 tripartite tricarboxylate transporter TctB family protein [Halomonas sp. LR3S48]
MKLAADRVLGLCLIGLAAFVAVQAARLHVPFSYDPVGPKAFPLILSILLGALSLVLVLKPGSNGHWPDRSLAVKLLVVLAALLIYALLFTRLGFVVTTLLTAVALARAFAAPWGKALLTGVLMAVGSYYVFTAGLGISLPSGDWLRPFI